MSKRTPHLQDGQVRICTKTGSKILPLPNAKGLCISREPNEGVALFCNGEFVAYVELVGIKGGQSRIRFIADRDKVGIGRSLPIENAEVPELV